MLGRNFLRALQIQVTSHRHRSRRQRARALLPNQSAPDYRNLRNVFHFAPRIVYSLPWIVHLSRAFLLSVITLTIWWQSGTIKLWNRLSNTLAKELRLVFPARC